MQESYVRQQLPLHQCYSNNNHQSSLEKYVVAYWLEEERRHLLLTASFDHNSGTKEAILHTDYPRDRIGSVSKAHTAIFESVYCLIILCIMLT